TFESSEALVLRTAGTDRQRPRCIFRLSGRWTEATQNQVRKLAGLAKQRTGARPPETRILRAGVYSGDRQARPDESRPRRSAGSAGTGKTEGRVRGIWRIAHSSAGVEPADLQSALMETGYRLQQWVFVERIGGGGMAEVWKARHTQFEEFAAVKFLLPNFSGDTEVQERFLREGRSQFILRHPN